MKLIAFGALGLFAFASLVLWLMTKIHYRISSRYLKIICLGLTVRRIDLLDIKRISKRKPSRAAEYWCCTLNPKHRILAIQRHRGLRKFVVISPRNRYIFLTDLQNAIKRVKPDQKMEALVDENEIETAGDPAPRPA